MNRKEMTEIRNHFGAEAKYFSMEQILTALIDVKGDVRGMRLRPYHKIKEQETDILFATMKKVLCPAIGKSTAELAFRNAEFAEGSPQDMLSTLLRSELKDEETALSFLTKLSETVFADEPFAVIAAYCQYSAPKKTKMDELDDENNDHIYRYIVVALCPVGSAESTLAYSSFDDEIFQQECENAIIGKTPKEGFLFPAFSDRAADVNHVMYYTKTPNTPNDKLVEDFLGCETEATIDEEQGSMKQVMQQLLGDDLTYEAVATVNEKLEQIVAKNKSDEAPTEITGHILHRILQDAGIPEDKLERTEEVFKECVDTTLKPERLVQPKTIIRTPEIVVNVKNDAKDKVRLETVNGKHCMVIALDEAMIEVNGYELKVPGMTE